MPYRLVYAVAAQDGITLHDTQQSEPIGIVANMHYASLTDVAW